MKYFYVLYNIQYNDEHIASALLLLVHKNTSLPAYVAHQHC
jgi:hypothetical protein